MNDNAIFRDNTGTGWNVNITYGDIIRVKQHVQTTEGKPLDLCYIAESGDFTEVSSHIDVIAQCMFWLLYPLIAEYSGKSGIEAQDWFYSRIDGDTIPSLITAWREAIVNFTPSPSIKTAMMIAGGMKDKAEIVTAIQLLAGQLETCTDMPVLLESILEDTPTDN